MGGCIAIFSSVFVSKRRRMYWTYASVLPIQQDGSISSVAYGDDGILVNVTVGALKIARTADARSGPECSHGSQLDGVWWILFGGSRAGERMQG